MQWSEQYAPHWTPQTTILERSLDLHISIRRDWNARTLEPYVKLRDFTPLLKTENIMPEYLKSRNWQLDYYYAPQTTIFEERAVCRAKKSHFQPSVRDA